MTGGSTLRRFGGQRRGWPVFLQFGVGILTLLLGWGTALGQTFVEFMPLQDNSAVAHQGAPGAVTLSFPTDLTAGTGQDFTTPLSADDATGIKAMDLRIEYDPSVITVFDVTRTSVTANFIVTPVVVSPGVLLISIYGANPMQGSGPLLDFTFNVIGSDGESTTIDLVSVIINEGDIVATLEDGFFIVCDASDSDDDGFSACDGDCRDDLDTVHPDAIEVCNLMDDDCNGLIDDDALGEDTDDDGTYNLCDNCPGTFNPLQQDLDDDFEGDHCDLDDGLIYISFEDTARTLWQEEFGYLTWNAYRGDLSTLISTGAYTQIPGSNDLADRECALFDAFWQDITVPDPGETAFFLATGVNGGGESDLGVNSAGAPRPNTNPCP